ncbi:RNA polymerase beta subunit [Erwinia phage PhiEaH1]|uniref:Virion structural protein n=1 Tax=Erwinia phage PhiEaH1 TaxID=1401669 RepID=W8D088_9CAUD|nr:RNA polymerase beta subunit [Erwinia phage PhiEaH1]AGX01894.1 virion structural protein [Erwinia phage PhiEaH1]
MQRMAELFPGTGNAEQFKKDLDALSPTQFAALMKGFGDGTQTPSAILPNLTKHTLTVDHLKNVAKKWGVELFHRLVVTDPDTGREMITPLKYMVIKIHVTRLSQMQETKMSIPEDNLSTDELTGQVTGDSKGSRLSFPEIGVLHARGHDAAILEAISVRGGDDAANRQLEYDIMTSGSGSLNRALDAGEGTTSTQNMATYFRVAHLDTTLDKGR